MPTLLTDTTGCALHQIAVLVVTTKADMRGQMTTRTKVMLLAGFAIFVAGGSGAAYFGSRGLGGSNSSPKVEVFYAAEAVETGTAGSAALAAGQIRARAVAPEVSPAGAVTDPSQVSSGVAAATIPVGTIVTVEMFPAPQTRIGTVVIPAGKRALALELQPVPGIAGFAGTGDRIDVYGVSRGEGAAPGVRLVLQAVDVLNVNGAGLPAAQGQPGSPNLIYLLAVTPAEAERLIYLSEFEKLWFDLVPRGEGRVTTPGAGPTEALRPG
ncbi:MAG: Flp pilus assembly protein CpaB [Acidimicrobiales bacterium]